MAYLSCFNPIQQVYNLTGLCKARFWRKQGGFKQFQAYSKIRCSPKCSPHWEHLERWLIQFQNPLLMGGAIGYVPFPEFFSLGNNSKYCSISGLFSVLGAPRKVIVTVLESSTHEDQSQVKYAISPIFQCGIIITKIVVFQACSLHWGHLAKWLIQFLNPLNNWEQSYDMRFPEFFNMVK